MRGRRSGPVHAFGLRHHVSRLQHLAGIERDVATGLGIPLEAPVPDLEASSFARQARRRRLPGVCVARVAPQDEDREQGPRGHRGDPASLSALGLAVPREKPDERRQHGQHVPRRSEVHEEPGVGHVAPEACGRERIAAARGARSPPGRGQERGPGAERREAEASAHQAASTRVHDGRARRARQDRDRGPPPRPADQTQGRGQAGQAERGHERQHELALAPQGEVLEPRGGGHVRVPVGQDVPQAPDEEEAAGQQGRDDGLPSTHPIQRDHREGDVQQPRVLRQRRERGQHAAPRGLPARRRAPGQDGQEQEGNVRHRTHRRCAQRGAAGEQDRPPPRDAQRLSRPGHGHQGGRRHQDHQQVHGKLPAPARGHGHGQDVRGERRVVEVVEQRRRMVVPEARAAQRVRGRDPHVSRRGEVERVVDGVGASREGERDQEQQENGRDRGAQRAEGRRHLAGRS